MPASLTFRVPWAQWAKAEGAVRTGNETRRGLDSVPPHQPHQAMRAFQFKTVQWPRVTLALSLAITVWAGPAIAAEQKPAAEPPAKPRPAKPSSLTGNALPKCEAGTYVAGHICKPAPPGFYAPSGGLYPVACAEGMTSRAGSRSASECYPEGGAPPAPPMPAKKGGS